MSIILLILGTDAHPDSDGEYNRALYTTAQATLSPNHNILCTDVQNDWSAGDEADKFMAADAVIFQFPVFWYMPPARLKAYLDTIYARGVFFGKVKRDGTAGLMTGHYMLSATWNAPAAHFGTRQTFFNGSTVDDALISMRKTQEFIGLKPLPHFHCHEVISSPDIKRDQARYRAHLDRVFG